MNQIRSGKSRSAAITALALLGALAWGSAACTAFYTKEPVLYRKNVAVYKVPAADYPGGDVADLMAPTQPFPELDVAGLSGALGNLEYKRQSAWGETHSRVFDAEELALIAPPIVEAMANTGPEYRLVVVTRFDRDKSVLSRMERNTLMLWTDEDGLNINFGEIREEIPENDFQSEADWTEILPVSFERAYPDLELVDEEFFELKKVGGFTHRTWAVIKVDDLAALKYHPQAPETGRREVGKAGHDAAKKSASDVDTESRSESYFDEANAPADRDPTERLRKLKRALDEELISPEEYEAQRQRILGDF